MYYKIADCVIHSQIEYRSFSQFICDNNHCNAEISVEETNIAPEDGVEIAAGNVVHRKQSNGIFFHPLNDVSCGVFTNSDYSVVKVLRLSGAHPEVEVNLLRLVIECHLAYRGYIPLHSACIIHERKALLFTGRSGMGKSTRARAWIEAFHDELLSGDRPLIDTKSMMVYGVPWDGKEACFKNISVPLGKIFDIRRSETPYFRRLSLEQKQEVMFNQCLMPMWDPELAAVQAVNINRLLSKADIVRMFSGPTSADAVAVNDLLRQGMILQEEEIMKVKKGFILRNVVDEYILVPVNERIAEFKGEIVLNELSALIWEKLESSISREDILQAILDTYEVEESTAAADLDETIELFKGYGVIE